MTDDTCPYCGATANRVNVHGHDQCSACYVNLAPCCTGERAHLEAEDCPVEIQRYRDSLD